MKRKPTILLSILFIAATLLSACSGTALPEPTPTTAPATPTAEPQPTPTEDRVESGFYSNAGGEWEPVFEDEMAGPVFLPEEMGGDMGTDNQIIQYGYFNGYDPESGIMSMYARIILVDLYRKIQIQIEDDQTAICLPETLGDTPIESVSFMLSNGSVSFPPGPGNVQIADILDDLNTSSYFIVVLAEPIQADLVNPVSSVALVCP